MQLNMRSLLAIMAAIVLAGIGLPLTALQSQSEPIVVSLVVSNYMKDVYTEHLIGDFESANPGVKIRLVTDAQEFVSSPVDGVDQHLEELGKYASAGDVLAVSSQTISAAGVDAGYFLDLTPLVAADKDLNPDDFLPAVWQSFQWDKGIWALPATTDIYFLTYDPAAFDQAGVSYPTDQWTTYEFINDIRKLTVKNPDGSLKTLGLVGYFPGYTDSLLIRSLSGTTLYEDSTLPTIPKFDKPAMATFLKAWSALDADGLLSTGKTRSEQLPMLLSDQYSLIYQPRPGAQDDSNVKRVGVLLPGEHAGLRVQGFAVSSGTQHPEQAYALARFLTKRPELIGRWGGLPARKSLMGVNTGDQNALAGITPEVQSFLDKAFAKAIPASELRYMEYFDKAMQQIKTDHVDPKTALQTQEVQSVKDQQAAIAKKTYSKLVVATPVPTPILKAGEVSLKFALGEFASPLPNKDLWDSLIKDFTSRDPQVRQIVLEGDFFFHDMKNAAQQIDCFEVPFNVISSQNIEYLLNLDPFLAADQSFDKDDMVGSTLSQLTIDNKIWGLPLAVTPAILKYNSDAFTQAGVPAPDSNWTVEKFRDTLAELKTDPKADPPFIMSMGRDGKPLLILITAYGGVPLDYRTDPPTINYTDPATVTAIRQVLDLAKQGYIKYEELGSFTSNGPAGKSAPHPAITNEYLSPFIGREAPKDSAPDPYKPISYPHGTQYTGANFGVSFAAISASSKNPEACYRWISLISKHPALFGGMPARRSLINDPALSAAQGKEIVAMYNAIDTQLRSPNVIIFPDQMGKDDVTGYLLQHWLYEAFDSYVLHDGNLDSALKDAQSYATGFQGCAKSLPPYDPSTPDTSEAYYKAVGDCAAKIDSRLKDLFQPKG